jgi:hypothetical protein
MDGHYLGWIPVSSLSFVADVPRQTSETEFTELDKQYLYAYGVSL